MEFYDIREELNYYQKRSQIMSVIEERVKRLGYVRFEPDYLEDYDTFVEVNQRFNKRSMVKIIEADGTISVLRPDITRALVKRLIPKWEDGLVLKLFYESTIFKRSTSGKTEEIRQFGIESLGDIRQDVDLEILGLIRVLLDGFGLDYRLMVSDNRFLSGLIRRFGLDQKNERTYVSLLMRKDRFGLQAFAKKNNIEDPLLVGILDLEGTLEEIKGQLSNERLDQNLMASLSHLETIEKTLDANGSSGKIVYDLALLTQYDHYDGIVFKGYLKDTTEAVLTGGRYDPLTRQFGMSVPAVGCSINIQDLIREVIKHEDKHIDDRDS